MRAIHLVLAAATATTGTGLNITFGVKHMADFAERRRLVGELVASIRSRHAAEPIVVAYEGTTHEYPAVGALAERYVRQPSFYYLGHFSRFLPPGARFVAESADSAHRYYWSIQFAPRENSSTFTIFPVQYSLLNFGCTRVSQGALCTSY